MQVKRRLAYDAIEFCARLSKLRGREYRLPSEAEWEYACRAGTTTPFYFGETITGKWPTHKASNTDADEPKGEYREETTPVGQFPPNAFGLYDMHGNVWEWCADDWHDNYDGAPTNGSVWIENGNDNRSLLRGGSWFNNPDGCRSACRSSFSRRVYNLDLGFRVVCGARRTL
jgi:formylglycine-generating enzyme required for sulfatase activity